MAEKTGNYSSDGSGVPWSSYRSSIRSIVVEEGVKVIGSACFHTCPNVTSVSLPSTLTEIGSRAFVGLTTYL
ncbi:MAG: leucine-rich repeat protein [Paludibacteraceae bacterium]|nr:leucine-rich repeat protein [Paludibacteraceae bacterium]